MRTGGIDLRVSAHGDVSSGWHSLRRRHYSESEYKEDRFPKSAKHDLSLIVILTNQCTELLDRLYEDSCRARLQILRFGSYVGPSTIALAKVGLIAMRQTLAEK